MPPKRGARAKGAGTTGPGTAKPANKPANKRGNKRGKEVSDESDTDNSDGQPKRQKTGKDPAPNDEEIDYHLPPISNPDAAFLSMASMSTDVVHHEKVHFRIATMCSGTEAPIFAVKMLFEFWSRLLPGEVSVDFSHVFSAEIVPFKQAYIARNTSKDTILFNDVQDFIHSVGSKAPTAMGSLETIPGDIDILIAGCSCVDFSTLNTQKIRNFFKSHGHTFSDDVKYTPGISQKMGLFFEELLENLDELGTSGKTFFSMLKYAKTYRPKVVILENVMGAPWKKTVDLWFPFAGYAAEFVKLDTKRHYIPHTRIRGYLVALDRQAFGDADAERIALIWRDLVQTNFARDVSTPVNSWLLPSAHPLTERARQDDSEKALTPSYDSAWERSKSRHLRARRTDNLGDGRPMTQWGLVDGQPYDRMDRLVTSTQPLRVLDCIDINQLRDLKFGFDSRFKNKIHDLSQNIDRTPKTMVFGIAGCITPNGIHWITDQTRILSGFEALLLQGLPLSQLEFATETQDQLRDLAGNAMSTTVVGSAFVALLSSIKRVRAVPLNTVFTRPIGETKKCAIRPAEAAHLQSIKGLNTTVAEPSDVASIIELLKRSRRYCFCNGSAKYSTSDFVRCVVCDTIRCKWCAGNPKHEFKRTTRPADFLLLSEVDHAIMRYFPTIITHLSIPSEWKDDHPFSTPLRFLEIRLQLQSTVFYYQSIHVTEVVTICYAGQESFELRAVLSEKGVCWYLYLDPWSLNGKKVTDHEHTVLAHPIARAPISNDARSPLPSSGSWQIWYAAYKPVDVKVTLSNGDLVITLGHNVALFDMIGPETRQQLQSIQGKYRHKPDCDAPEDTLHVLESKGKKLFLFKDTTRTGLLCHDGYIISEECRFLEPHEHREVIIKFPGALDIRSSDGMHTFQRLEEFWTTKSDYIVNILGPPQQVLAELRVVRHKISDRYMIVKKHQTLTAVLNRWTRVDKSELHHLFEFISHANIKLAIAGFNFRFEMTDIKEYIDEIEAWRSDLDAEDCPFGLLPRVQWLKWNGGYVGHHLSKAITDFESRAKLETPAFETRIRVGANLVAPRDMYDVRVQYVVEPKMLAGRAATHLPPSDDPNARVIAFARADTNVIISRNVTIASGTPNAHSFEPFRKSLLPLDGSSSKLDPLVESLMATFRTKLSDKQKGSLGWMLSRERQHPTFTEQEIEEYLVPDLKLRLIGCAERKICNHGGVLADDVGYGKTVITLALTHCQQKFDKQESISQRNTKNPRGMHLEATLVLVPRHLVDQWAEQALKFLPIDKSQVIKIKKTTDLKDDSQWSVLDQLHSARLIIVSSEVLADHKYHMNLARLSGSLDPPVEAAKTRHHSVSTSKIFQGRAFQEWYGDAAQVAHSHVGVMLSGVHQGSFNAVDHESLYEAIEGRRGVLLRDHHRFQKDYEQRLHHANIETRLATQKFPLTKEMAPPKGPSSKGKKMKSEFIHVLEAFSFARVVYDEFSYENLPAAIFVSNSQAYSKWVLSATPPTRNLAAVCGIANLLKVHVARRALRRQGLPRITEGPELKEKTNAEDLQSRQFMSDQRIRERHDQACRFLESFATSNPLDKELAGGITVEEVVVASEMSRYEYTLYMDLQQDLRAAGMDALALPKESRSLLSPILDAQVWAGKGNYIAMEALLTRSSRAPYRPPEHKDKNEDEETLSLLLKQRRSMLKEALKILKADVDQAIWLSLRIFNNEKEYERHNAQSSILDICMVLRDIWEKRTDACGGLDVWTAVFKAIIGDCDDDFAEQVRTSVINRIPGFDLDDKVHQKAYITIVDEWRKTSWPDYYDLDSTASYFKHISEEDAADLLEDYKRIGSIPAELQGSSNLKTLKALAIELKKEKGKEKGSSATVLVTPNETHEKEKKKTKAEYGNLLRSAGVKFNMNRKAADIAEIWERHRRGTLPISSYVEFGNRSVGKPEVFPILNHTKQVRGGEYSLSGNDVSDTSLNLRQSLQQVAYCQRQERILKNATSSRTELPCDGCGKIKSKNELHLVCSCGHLLCEDHLKLETCGDCGLNGPTSCPSVLKDATVLLANINRSQRVLDGDHGSQTDSLGPDLPNRDPSSSVSTRHIGSKSQMIASTVKTIPTGEYVILFVQFDQQIIELEKALKWNGIGFTTNPSPEEDGFKYVKGLGRMGQDQLQTACVERGLPDYLEVPHMRHRLAKWMKETRGQETYPKVRILKLNDSTSAGTNLQYANHVMFATPLLAELQEEYDAVMKQARGRCIRYGQERTVKVWHFVTAHTVEVDILELRRLSRVIVPPGKAIGRLEPEQPTRYRDPRRHGSERFTISEQPTNADDSDVVMNDVGDAAQPIQGDSTSNTPGHPTDDENIKSLLTAREMWKAMNEMNWLTTVGIEY
ncbi:hypothetical protein GGR54DRAFT_637484 [Hypoxylon sp. NC1633]|nr:hypothetical protein GGR54DRAFT_637484 [Hypoxylon sp. NC1633]